MKIVDVSGFYSETGGGVASYVRQKFAAAARHGHELVVIAPGAESGVVPREGGRIVWVAAPQMPLDANYRMFLGGAEAWRVMDAEAPDVVEGSSPWRGGWIAANWRGEAARALVFHQDFVAGYPYTALGRIMSPARIDAAFAGWWAYVRRLSLRFDVTVTGGEWLAQRLARFGVHRPQAVPFGIETELFSPAHRDEALRRELLAACGSPPDARLLISVGRLHPEKRHRTLIEAFARVRTERSDVALAIIGDGLARRLVERAAARTPGVALVGTMDRRRLAAAYASADLLVHGSGAETYGLAVAEAIASGLAVVAPDAGGAADLARRGRARLYALGDAGSCAAAIERALAGELDAPTAPPPTDSAAHFEALFGLYEQLVEERRRPLARAA
ncbi:MAG TPA: glycosyltransferase [Caulobacteraceae bacterium]|jgi:alpha-1,6-mannosyltransferase|nr:glycosyltransferase [Caulobacteraceae bacterium]